MVCDSYLNLALISGLPRKGVKCVCIVFSLERELKRENKGAKKAKGVWRGVSIVGTHISIWHSFLDSLGKEYFLS